MPRSTPTTTTTDTGPAERARHGTVKLELTGRGHAVRARVTDSCEIDRLYERDLIDDDQHSAAERLANLCRVARIGGCPTARWLRSARSSDIPTSQAEALASVGAALAAVEETAGAASRAAVLAVVVDDVRVERRGLDVLRPGLDALAGHLGPGRARAPVPGVVVGVQKPVE